MNNSNLSSYLMNFKAKRTLSAREEYDAAKHLNELERKLWLTILDDEKHSVSLLKTVINAIRERNSEKINMLPLAEIEDLTKQFTLSRTVDIAEQLISKLYEIDEDKELLEYATVTIANKDVTDLHMHLKQAKHRFIEDNMGLVVNIAKRFHVDQMSPADLIQEGNIGLMRAVDKFDYKKGFRFSTYAAWWIRSYISRAIVLKANTVRIPEYMLRDKNRMKRTEEASRVKFGRTLNDDELAAELGVSNKRLSRTKKHDVAYVESLDRDMPGGDNQKYVDFLADEETKNPFEAATLNSWIRNLPERLSLLSSVERFVISRRFGLIDGNEMTLQEIGECLSLSRERVRQIQEEALGKLRSELQINAA